MAFEGCKKLWFNGELVNFEDAKIHVLCHGVHYGSSIFEGERCYKQKKGSAIFRSEDHTKRLFNSAKISDDVCGGVFNSLVPCVLFAPGGGPKGLVFVGSLISVISDIISKLYHKKIINYLLINK